MAEAVNEPRNGNDTTFVGRNFSGNLTIFAIFALFSQKFLPGKKVKLLSSVKILSVILF